jgi:hypothetical protein
MRLLLSDACSLLYEYAEYGMCQTDPRLVKGINLAIERLLPALNPEKTVGRYKFSVNNSQVTLPRDVKTILSGVIGFDCQPGIACPQPCGGVLQIKSRWYEMLPGGPRGMSDVTCTPNATLIDLGTGFFTFSDITSDYPCYIRVYATLPESPPPPGEPTISGGGPAIWVSGKDINGNTIYSQTSDGVWVETQVIPIPIIGTDNYIDSAVAYNEITAVSKPLTHGPLSLYALSLDKTVQTPIAVYQPEETRIDYRRYMLTWCGPNIPTSITVLAKRQFVWTTDQTTDLFITNIGALQNALMAMKFEKAGSFQQAAACWKTAFETLDRETRDYDGDYQPSIQFQDAWGGGDIASLR